MRKYDAPQYSPQPFRNIGKYVNPVQKSTRAIPYIPDYDTRIYTPCCFHLAMNGGFLL